MYELTTQVKRLLHVSVIRSSGPDNGIVATGHLFAIMGDGKEGILSFHDKRLDGLSLREVVVKLKTVIPEHVFESLTGIGKVLNLSSNPCLL